MKIIESVPNFSEGQNQSIINAIAKALSSQKGTKLLDIDSGVEANRTVYSLIGTEESIGDALFEGVKIASKLIDLSSHKGTHPRIGALDVCPLIPLYNADLNDCHKIALKLGKKMWEQLKIPIYLYENSATTPSRKNLANIRKGEYEGLFEKLKDPLFTPDFGKAVFNQKSGISVLGARDFLIAYNINISGNLKDAKNIAKRIRESGYTVMDKNKNPVVIKGLLKSVKAIGWYIEEFKKAQVSTNIINYKETSIFDVFNAVKNEAQKLKIEVTGSELVGMIPLSALTNKVQDNKNISKNQLEKNSIFDAIKKLGLSEVKKFDPDKKIIDYRFSLDDFLS